MHPVKSSRSALSVLGLAVALVGFGCTSSDGGGTGGSPGTGGENSGTGGAGTGGSHATGGSTGTGGTATGGITGTGGTPATGGVTGTGGTPATGGVTGTGGTPATGGSGGHATGGVGGGGAGHAGGGSNGTAGTSGGGNSGTAFSLTSNDQANGAHFNAKFTCQESPPLSGKTVGGLQNGINPDLEWMNAPAGTMSFAITFLDTTLINANMDSLGNHWAIWNIPATVMSFPEGTSTLSGTLANAKQSGTFLAPCAQSLMNNMDDQYAFTIYALSVPTITASTVANARTALMTAMTAGQVLGTATLTGHAGLKGM
jgi:phosphatidylethanolamine-binding protein (PEBP) family uncharacterized protein